MGRMDPNYYQLRKFAVGTILVLVFCFVGQARAEGGLAAHYTFDEGSGSVARDLSGKGNAGKIYGARYVKIQKGYALEFDGKDDYVEVPDSDSLKITDMITVEAWINSRDLSGAVIGKNGFSTYRANYMILLQPADLSFYVNCFGEEKYVRVKSSPIATNKWYQIVGTYDGADIKVYINGVLKGTNNVGKFVIGTHNNPLYIGANYYADSVGASFKGLIDDVKIYNRTLPGEEIVSSYESWMKMRGWNVSAGSLSLSAFKQVDTTPPVVNLATPPPDSTVSADSIITAKFADAGSGIDVSSAKILLDGKDMTNQAEVTATGITLRPEKPLVKGIHRVEVGASDQAGNRSNSLKWLFGVEVPVTVEARFDKGLFLVNGEPYFPMGIYCGATRPSKPETSYLAQAAAAGINYQLMPETAGWELLDIMLKHGMKAMKQVHYASKALANGDKSLLEKAMETKDHPATLGWWSEYLAGTQEGIQAMTPIYRLLKENDLRHPVIWICCWAVAHKWCTNTDAYFVPHYPILNPVHDEYTVLSLYHTMLVPTFAAAAAEGKGKQVWFVSQAFDYRINEKRDLIITPPGEFRPNPSELRAMNYLALAKGVKGLLFYAPGSRIAGTRDHNALTYYPKPWNEALKIASEVRHLSPLLASGKPVQTARLEPENPAIHYLELRHKDVHILIAVNVRDVPVRTRWLFAKPSQPKVLFEDRILSEKTNAMTDMFKPLEVHIYQWK